MWVRRTDSVGTQAAFLTEDDDMPWVMGSASSSESEIPLSENEEQRERRLRRERLARKRPMGFAPWKT